MKFSVKVQFQGAGARPWLLERRDGLARGIHDRLAADDSFASERIPTDAQYRLDTLPSASGYSASQMVFGSEPAALYGWRDADERLSVAHDTSSSGQFAQQWKIRIMARVGAPKEIANGKFRRQLA